MFSQGGLEKHVTAWSLSVSAKRQIDSVWSETHMVSVTM